MQHKDSRDAAGSRVQQLSLCHCIHSSNCTCCNSGSHALHLIDQCSTSSTSPCTVTFFAHLSSLATSLHLLISISSPGVPLLSFIIILLSALFNTLTHSDHALSCTLQSSSTSPTYIGFVSISCMVPSSHIFLQVMASNKTLTFTVDNWSLSTLTSFHSTCPQHKLIIPIQIVLPNLTASAAIRFNNRLSF